MVMQQLVFEHPPIPQCSTFRSLFPVFGTGATKTMTWAAHGWKQVMHWMWRNSGKTHFQWCIILLTSHLFLSNIFLPAILSIAPSCLPLYFHPFLSLSASIWPQIGPGCVSCHGDEVFGPKQHKWPRLHAQRLSCRGHLPKSAGSIPIHSAGAAALVRSVIFLFLVEVKSPSRVHLISFVCLFSEERIIFLQDLCAIWHQSHSVTTRGQYRIRKLTLPAQNKAEENSPLRGGSDMGSGDNTATCLICSGTAEQCL